MLDIPFYFITLALGVFAGRYVKNAWAWRMNFIIARSPLACSGERVFNVSDPFNDIYRWFYSIISLGAEFYD